MNENSYSILEASKKETSELQRGDFGYRRKRNIELDWGQNIQTQRGEHALGINWDDKENDIDVEEEKGDSTVMEADSVEDTPIQEIMIGNRQVDIEKFKTKVKAQDSQKLTIYLDGSLMNALKLLKKNKIIESYSQCIKDALIQYLTE